MSSVSVLIDDAEKIAAELVPSTNLLAPVVGVLIQHVEKLVGHELTSLEDKALGGPAAAEEVNPPETPTATAQTVAAAQEPAPAEPAPVDPSLQDRLDALKSQLEETEAAIKAAQS